MRHQGLDAWRLAPLFIDNRRFQPGSGRGTLLGSHLLSRRPRSGSFAARTGARAAAPQSSTPPPATQCSRLVQAFGEQTRRPLGAPAVEMDAVLQEEAGAALRLDRREAGRQIAEGGLVLGSHALHRSDV